MSLTADDLGTIAAGLITEWDRAGSRQDVASDGAAQFESLTMPRRPMGGLAIGRSVSPDTGAPRLEMRVTAKAGPNHMRATKLARQAEAQGVEVVLKFLKNSIMGEPLPRASVIKGRRKPLHVGASIANREWMAGTLGAFVKLPDGGPGILSCGHVLARIGKKWGAASNPIHQPGQPEESPVVAANRIGELTALFAPFVDSQTNNLDAAIGRLDPGQDHSGNKLIDLDCVPADFRNRAIGAPLVTAPDIGARVVKLGRTTGFTEAIISAVDFQNLRVRFGTGNGAETFTFSGVYEVLWDTGTKFAAGGDSGSLVMTQDGLHPIGLHFSSVAGEDGSWASYVIPWPRIFEAFDVTLL